MVFCWVHSFQASRLIRYWVSHLKSSVEVWLHFNHTMKISEMKFLTSQFSIIIFFSFELFESLSPSLVLHWETPSCSWEDFVKCMTWFANVAIFTIPCFIETSHLERDSVLTDSPRKQQPGSHSLCFGKGQEQSHGPLPCCLGHR